MLGHIEGVCIIALMDSRKYFIVSVAIIAIVTGIWLTSRVLTPLPLPQTATVLPAATDLAEFSLLDQDSAAFTRSSFEGRWNLVFFGFTHCPDICPLTLQILSTARQQMADAGQDELPRIVLVSVDPERDTPEAIGNYVAHFGEDTIGVTGDMAELRKLTEGLGVFFEKSGIEGDNYSVDHSAVVVVVDPDGRFHSLFGAPHKPENFAHDLPIIMSIR
jgi:protein SCO1/2